MSEHPHEFTDEFPLKPEEFVALVSLDPLPPFRVMCHVSHPMYGTAGDWDAREDGRLTHTPFFPQMGGGSEPQPTETASCLPADLRSLLDDVVREQLWLYAEDYNAWEAAFDMFDSPDELRFYVCFEGRRFIMGCATGDGLAPVLRVAERFWALFPPSQRPNMTSARLG